jgi:hypothetical protein
MSWNGVSRLEAAAFAGEDTTGGKWSVEMSSKEEVILIIVPC